VRRRARSELVPLPEPWVPLYIRVLVCTADFDPKPNSQRQQGRECSLDRLLLPVDYMSSPGYNTAQPGRQLSSRGNGASVRC
jgi:hypothetical protein